MTTMKEEIAELKILMAENTKAVTTFTTQFAVLNQERLCDHTLIREHEIILRGDGSGEGRNSGLINKTSNLQRSFDDITGTLQKVFWIVATPVLIAAVVVAFLAISDYLRK